MGFLLQQIRADNAPSDVSTSQRESSITKKNTASEEITSKEQIVSLPNKNLIHSAVVEKRENKELPNDSSFFADLKPAQVISNCFNEGTTPDFGLHIHRFIGENNYVRSCRWSPDGNWLLTDSVDRITRLFLYSDSTLKLHHKLPLGGLIYDTQWAPFATQNCFLTTSQGQPIHCWDIDGKLLASYRGINDMDELEHAYSLSFSLDGQCIFGGYRNRLRIFECERSGKQSREIKTFVKGKFGGQKGIVSALSMCPTFGGVFAVASSNGSVGLYSTLTNSCDCLLNGSSDGPAVTHLQYSSDGNLLFAGLRKKPSIQCFDLRMPGHLLANYQRTVETNQRFFFQLDPFDRYLYSGSSTGELLIFNCKINVQLAEDGKEVEPTFRAKCSKSAVAGLSLHPIHQLVALSTGQRIFPDLLPELFPENESSSSSAHDQSVWGSDVGKGNGAEGGEWTEKENGRKGRRSELDNSVKLLKFYE
ncbi:hypothetical protein niasHS_017604 [Heterodera schachtii]|uniref:WD repeat-containing protein 79 n=1 Tax=Heterodera schachtii TaxID=97005 RepID=A0ABD2I609_HETSC